MWSHSFLASCGNVSPGCHNQRYPGNLCRTDQMSLSVPVNSVPAARGEVQTHPCNTFMLIIPPEASAEGWFVGAMGTGGNGLKTLTSFYPNCHKATGSWQLIQLKFSQRTSGWKFVQPIAAPCTNPGIRFRDLYFLRSVIWIYFFVNHLLYAYIITIAALSLSSWISCGTQGILWLF